MYVPLKYPIAMDFVPFIRKYLFSIPAQIFPDDIRYEGAQTAVPNIF
jgi:hypothetical protein